MKNLIIIMLILTCTVNAQQVRFNDKEYSNISITVDPIASYKEKSPNLTFEFEYVCYFLYIKPSVQVLPGLEGGYIDATAGLGLNLIQGYEEDWRLYGGIRLGHNWRGTEDYPLFGWELGLDRRVTDDFSIGIRSTLDYRFDFKYTGGDPGYQINGGIRFRYNL